MELKKALPETGGQTETQRGAEAVKADPPLQNRGDNRDKEKNKGHGTETPKNKGSKVHRLSQGKTPYMPKKADRKRPALLTVDQYLRKATLDQGIADLVRSLHKMKIMTFEEWEREVANLLKKKTW
jgi:hypothetical protein